MRLLPLLVLTSVFSVARAEEADPVYIFTTIAGQAGSSGATDGPAGTARFNHPWGIAVDSAGNVLVADASGHTLRKITPTGVVSTLAGQAGIAGSADGIGTAAQFGRISTNPGSVTSFTTGPLGLAVDRAGTAYATDSAYHTIRRITANGTVTTYAGLPGINGTADGPALGAVLSVPTSVAVDSAGAVFVADCFNHLIRRISPTGALSTIAGAANVPGSADGLGLSAARFLHPTAVALDVAGNVYVNDSNNTIRRISPPGGSSAEWTVTTIAGTAGAGGSTDGVGANARFGIARSISTSISIRFNPPNLAPATPGFTYIIGDLSGLVVDAAGNIFVTDQTNQTIRKISPALAVTTIAGSAGVSGKTDGLGRDSRFFRPAGIAVDAAGNLYIADSLNHTIRKGGIGATPTIRADSIATFYAPGATAVLTTMATGYPTPTYQWTKNGVPLAGATAATLTLTDLKPADLGTYLATATNLLGSATTNSLPLSFGTPPSVAVETIAQSVREGQSVTLSAIATALPPPTFQWLRNGSPLAGATSATLVITGALAQDAGDYSVVVTNAAGSITSPAIPLAVDTGRLANLSIRAALKGGTPLIVGFVTRGGPKPLLARAVGPTLRQFGLANALADPELALFSGGTAFATNDNWSDSAVGPTLALAAAQVGAFALPVSSLDAGLLITLNNGAITAQVTGKNSGAGVVLFELYDSAPFGPARLVNVSTRSSAGAGENVLTAGFVIGGNSRRTLLIRAIGPALAQFGVSGALTDPRLDIFAAGAATPLASNDDWAGSPLLTASFALVGAFPLPSPSSKDAALLISLAPGSYSAQVSGAAGATGEVLLEIYELP